MIHSSVQYSVYPSHVQRRSDLPLLRWTCEGISYQEGYGVGVGVGLDIGLGVAVGLAVAVGVGVGLPCIPSA